MTALAIKWWLRRTFAWDTNYSPPWWYVPGWAVEYHVRYWLAVRISRRADQCWASWCMWARLREPFWSALREGFGVKTDCGWCGKCLPEGGAA